MARYGHYNPNVSLDPVASALLKGATVTVYQPGTTTLASIFSSRTGGAKANPFTTDATTGNFDFWAPPGEYDLRVGAGPTVRITVLSGPTLLGANAYIVYVDNQNGDDAHDGRTPETAKKTIETAYAALPAAYGGLIRIITRGTGFFDVLAPMVFYKPTYIDGIGVDSVALRRKFSGPIFTWKAAGGLYRLTLDDDGQGGGARAGAAVKLGSDSRSVFCSSFEMDGVRFSASGGDANAWEHMIEIDGAQNTNPTGNGVRRVFITNCMVFGCRTPGETIKIMDLVHGHFSGIEMVAAPTNIRQGIKVLSSNRAGGLGSEDVEFTTSHLLGDIYIDGKYVTWRGGMVGWEPLDEAIPSVDIASTAEHCYADGVIRGAIRDRSATSRIERHLSPRALLDFPATLDMLGQEVAYSALAGANRQYYWRSVGSGYITGIALTVGTQSGNISVSVYRNTGRGRSAAPGARRATSGSVPCPAPGYAEVALTAGIYVEVGDWIALSCDNTTATFLRGATPFASALTRGRSLYSDNSHPGPADVTTAGKADQGHGLVLVGV